VLGGALGLPGAGLRKRSLGRTMPVLPLLERDTRCGRHPASRRSRREDDSGTAPRLRPCGRPVSRSTYHTVPGIKRKFVCTAVAASASACANRSGGHRDGIGRAAEAAAESAARFRRRDGRVSFQPAKSGGLDARRGVGGTGRPRAHARRSSRPRSGRAPRFGGGGPSGAAAPPVKKFRSPYFSLAIASKYSISNYEISRAASGGTAPLAKGERIARFGQTPAGRTPRLSPDSLKKVDAVKDILVGAARACGATIVDVAFHEFNPSASAGSCHRGIPPLHSHLAEYRYAAVTSLPAARSSSPNGRGVHRVPIRCKSRPWSR